MQAIRHIKIINKTPEDICEFLLAKEAEAIVLKYLKKAVR